MQQPLEPLTAHCRFCQKIWPVEELGCFKERPLLVGDTYWRLICQDCNNKPSSSTDHQVISHKIERDLITWPVILHLILYNLQIQRPDKKYFKMKEEISPTILKYWDDLMPHKSKSSNWENTISSALSTHQDIFLSGIAELGQLGWWTLRKKEPPYSLNNYHRSKASSIASQSNSSTTKTNGIVMPKKKETKISLLQDSLAKMSPEQLEAFVSKLSKARQQNNHPMTQEEEKSLAQRLAAEYCGKGKNAALSRLKAKLAYRSHSGNLVRPAFNLDQTLIMYMKAPLDSNSHAAVAPFKFHPLFTVKEADLPFISDPSLSFSHKIDPKSRMIKLSKSSFTSESIIKRDWDCIPPKLGILRFFSNQIHPVDFVHINPQLLGPVNRLLCQFFWPGIDMSEFLICPEYSIVATYKKLVVGCAFMTPPESCYITFLLVHPDWERSNIGSYMLWYLIQQSGPKRDITLHVSASNPALILYQKFGFKPEQFIVKFYDKYYDCSLQPEQSRNAFFLRLKK